MPGCLSTTICLPLVGGLGRRGPSQEPQSSLSEFLFHAPTRKSIEHSSNTAHSTICILNDDALLNIFYIYQLHICDEQDNEDVFSARKWDPRWWYKLAHVSRKWWCLILASPFRLNLYLFCTYGMPVADMLAHSPPLPLIIFYHDCNHQMTAEDEEGALLALRHHDRVRHIALWALARTLEKFITAMDEEFPILEHIYIRSLTDSGRDTNSIIPRTFQAPNLRHINLDYTALPIGSSLLTTTTGLVTLWLGSIPRSAYFTPSYILTRLSLMPQLETLGIEFSSLSNHDVLSDTPIVTHITLPNLRAFSFIGDSAYLEGLLTWVSAPVLSTLHIDYFPRFTFTLPCPLQFMQTSKNLIFDAVRLTFHRNFLVLIALQGGQLRPLEIMWRGHFRQVAPAVEILRTISPVLSVVEKLTLYDMVLN
jgi:hypothetical protein